MSEKQKKKKNVLSKVIIILLLLIVVGGAAFGGMYYFSNKSSKTAKAVVIPEVTYSLEEFLVNLLDNNGATYLKVTVYVGYQTNTDLTTEITAQKPVIRDIVNTYLRSKKSSDFSGSGIDTIKSDLIQRINPVLTKGKISHIYFNSIVISQG